MLTQAFNPVLRRLKQYHPSKDFTARPQLKVKGRWKQEDGLPLLYYEFKTSLGSMRLCFQKLKTNLPWPLD